ncbi:MAG: HDOD domain-containing protein [Gammaproteobacteria bacterium]|nr:HDOD domain-containing protein [Gammaproteobacteria bacterium]
MVLRFLKYFLPFQHLNDHQLIELANLIQIKKIAANKTFIQLHSDSVNQYFLIDGTVEVGDETTTQWLIHSRSENSRNPLSRYRPSRYSVKSITEIKVVIVDLETVLQFANKTAQVDASEEIKHHYLYKQLLKDLTNNRLQLPSVPDVAIKIRQSLYDEKSNFRHIANIIASDPAITTKIIKTANSALYRSIHKIDDCQMAVTRLGTKVTSQLVTSFSMKELFKTRNKTLKKRMLTIWKHSREVAALSFILAKITPGFNPEHALLAGLLHDIGAIPIISYADKHPEMMENEDHFLALIEQLKGEVGAAILSKWDFSEDLITTAREAENWLRQPGEKPEYCDIIIVAQLHALVGQSGADKRPRLDEVPAFSKLALGQLTPELSIKVLEQAKEQVEETINLLA